VSGVTRQPAAGTPSIDDHRRPLVSHTEEFGDLGDTDGSWLRYLRGYILSSPPKPAAAVGGTALTRDGLLGQGRGAIRPAHRPCGDGIRSPAPTTAPCIAELKVRRGHSALDRRGPPSGGKRRWLRGLGGGLLCQAVRVGRLATSME
jgi:hypothetical protein